MPGGWFHCSTSPEPATDAALALHLTPTCLVVPEPFIRHGRITLLRLAVLLTLLAGYLELAAGGLTLAPILLVASYVVLVPLAILVR
jgi:hypothetical protein